MSMSWTRTGSVTVTQGAEKIQGSGTLWLTTVKAGDLFSTDSDVFYEVTNVDGNNTLTLDRAFEGQSGSGLGFMIIPLSTKWSMNAELAQQLAEHIVKFNEKLDKNSTLPAAGASVTADDEGSIAQWTDALRQATMAQKGIVQLTTPSELTDDSITTKAVTPATLKAGQAGGVALLNSSGYLINKPLNMAGCVGDEITSANTFGTRTDSIMVASKTVTGIVDGTSEKYFVIQKFLTERASNSARFEVAFGADSAEAWTRFYNGAWSAWHKLAFSEDVATAMGETVCPKTAETADIGTESLYYKNVYTKNLQTEGDDASVMPPSNNKGNIGTEAQKWGHVYASTFHGALKGNADTATTADTANSATSCSGNAKTATKAASLGAGSIDSEATVTGTLNFKVASTMSSMGMIKKDHYKTGNVESDNGTIITDKSISDMSASLGVSAAENKAFFKDCDGVSHKLAYEEDIPDLPTENTWFAFNTNAGVQKYTLPNDGHVYAALVLGLSSTSGVLTLTASVKNGGEDLIPSSLVNVHHISGFYWQV